MIFLDKEVVQAENGSLSPQEAKEPQTSTTQDAIALQNVATCDIFKERIAQFIIDIAILIAVLKINIITNFLLALALPALYKI